MSQLTLAFSLHEKSLISHLPHWLTHRLTAP